MNGKTSTAEGKESRLQKWFPKGKDSEELKPVKDTLAERSQFWQMIKRKLTKTELKEVMENASASDQSNDFRAFDDETYESLVKRVKACMAETERGNEELIQKRATGMRRISDSVQKFAQSFNEFLHTYSGLVDVLQAVDAQYGGLAWGTLSLLFIVAANKQRIEDLIQSAIEDLRDRLPEVTTYEQVYPDKSLRENVAKVFRGVVIFARTATLYCKGHGYSRWMHALGGPRELEDSIEDIRIRVANVRASSDVLLSKRIQEIYKENQELNEKVSRKAFAPSQYTTGVATPSADPGIENIVELQANIDHTHLTSFMSALGISDFRIEEYHSTLAQYKASLFHLTQKRKLERMVLASLEKKQEYSDWLFSPHSCVLALSGKNARGMPAHSLFWVSPVAIEVIERLKDQGAFVTYHLCQVSEANIVSGQEPAAEHVLLSLIGQMLVKKPSILRDPAAFDRLSALTRSQEWHQKEADAFYAVLKSVIALLSEQCPDLSPMYIILDRVDRCEGSDISQERLMRELLRLTNEVACVVKILVVSRDDFWELEKHISEFGIPKTGSTKFVHLSLKQQRL